MQFSLARPLDQMGRRGNIRDDSAEILFQSFFRRDPCEQFWHRHECPLFDVVYPAFPLPTTASPTIHDAVKDVLKMLSWRATCPNHASFPLLTVA